MQQQVERDAVAAIPTVALEHEFRLVLGRTVPVDQSGGVGGSKQRLAAPALPTGPCMRARPAPRSHERPRRFHMKTTVAQSVTERR